MNGAGLAFFAAYLWVAVVAAAFALVWVTTSRLNVWNLVRGCFRSVRNVVALLERAGTHVQSRLANRRMSRRWQGRVTRDPRALVQRRKALRGTAERGLEEDQKKDQRTVDQRVEAPRLPISVRSYSSTGGEESEAKETEADCLRKGACEDWRKWRCTCSVGAELNKGAPIEQNAADVCPELHRELVDELEAMLTELRCELQNREELYARWSVEQAQDLEEVRQAGEELYRVSKAMADKAPAGRVFELRHRYVDAWERWEELEGREGRDR